MEKDPDDRLAELIRSHCLDTFEGCCCELLKGHHGLHLCAAKGCGTTWSDEESAAAWEVEKASWRKSP